MQIKEFYQNHKRSVLTGGITGAVLLVVGLFVVGIAFGSSGGASGAVARGGFVSTSVPANSFSSFARVAKSSEGIVARNTTPSTQKGDLSQKEIIKNASLSLVVGKIEQAISEIKMIADTSSGFVSNSNIYENGSGKKSGIITLRVPASKFNESLSKIKNLAVKVSRESINSRDVTEQFVDMKVRLKNMKAEEQQYLSIMKRAVKIKDVLDVTKSLSDVRGRIERLEGQINYLSRQIDMSTISVNLTSEANVEVFGIVWNPISILKQGVRSMLQGFVNFINTIIAFILYLPVILLWVVLASLLLWLGWKGVIITRRKYFKS